MADFDLTQLFGLASGSTAGGSTTSTEAIAGTALDAAGAAVGIPPGVGSTIVKTIGNLFPCAGKESFGPEPYARFVAYVDKRIAESTNMKMLADALTFISEEIPRSDLEIARFESECSKKYRAQYRDYCKSLITKYYDPTKMYSKPFTGVDFKNASYNCLIYFAYNPTQAVNMSTYSTSATSPTNSTDLNSILSSVGGLGGIYPTTPTVNTQISSTGTVGTELNQQLLPNELLALQNFVTSPDNKDRLTLSDLIPKFLNGQITIQNGKVIWGFSATNQDNSNTYLILGAMGILGVLLLRKKH